VEGEAGDREEVEMSTRSLRFLVFLAFFLDCFSLEHITDVVPKRP